MITRTLTAAVAGAAIALTASDVLAQDIAVRGATVHVGNGEMIENATVLVAGGRITAVGPDVRIPGGTTVIDIDDSAVTPGLIDAFARVERADPFEAARRTNGRTQFEKIMRRIHGEQAFACTCTGFSLCPAQHMHEQYEMSDVVCPLCAFPQHAPLDVATGLISTRSFTESTSEVVPHTSVLDSVNLRAPDFDRLALGGVTTVFVSPDSAAVIGPRGAIVKTAGPVRKRVLEHEDAVHAAVTSDTFRFGPGNAPPFQGFVNNQTRRPNTRMGLAWVFRKAFFDAERHVAGKPISGADAAPAEALEVVSQVRAGDVPLRVHARQATDIESALRFAGEFGLRFTLLEATEAYDLVPEIASADIPVVFGPIEANPTGPRRFTGEANDPRLGTFQALLDAGVRTALSAQDLREENGLARQAMYAVRYGVEPADAIRAVTLTPAEILGIDDEVGSLEAGKTADIVIWNGDPLAPTSKPVVVIVNGRVEIDHR